jgi:hypothetical protein
VQRRESVGSETEADDVVTFPCGLELDICALLFLALA